MILAVQSQVIVFLLPGIVVCESNITAGNCDFDSDFCLYDNKVFKLKDRTWSGYTYIRWERNKYHISNIQNTATLRDYEHKPTRDHTTGAGKLKA